MNAQFEQIQEIYKMFDRAGVGNEISQTIGNDALFEMIKSALDKYKETGQTDHRTLRACEELNDLKNNVTKIMGKIKKTALVARKIEENQVVVERIIKEMKDSIVIPPDDQAPIVPTQDANYSTVTHQIDNMKFVTEGKKDDDIPEHGSGTLEIGNGNDQSDNGKEDDDDSETRSEHNEENTVNR